VRGFVRRRVFAYYLVIVHISMAKLAQQAVILPMRQPLLQQAAEPLQEHLLAPAALAAAPQPQAEVAVALQAEVGRVDAAPGPQLEARRAPADGPGLWHPNTWMRVLGLNPAHPPTTWRQMVPVLTVLVVLVADLLLFLFALMFAPTGNALGWLKAAQIITAVDAGLTVAWGGRTFFLAANRPLLEAIHASSFHRWVAPPQAGAAQAADPSWFRRIVNAGLAFFLDVLCVLALLALWFMSMSRLPVDWALPWRAYRVSSATLGSLCEVWSAFTVVRYYTHLVDPGTQRLAFCEQQITDAHKPARKVRLHPAVAAARDSAIRYRFGGRNFQDLYDLAKAPAALPRDINNFRVAQAIGVDAVATFLHEGPAKEAIRHIKLAGRLLGPVLLLNAAVAVVVVACLFFAFWFGENMSWKDLPFPTAPVVLILMLVMSVYRLEASSLGLTRALHNQARDRGSRLTAQWSRNLGRLARHYKEAPVRVKVFTIPLSVALLATVTSVLAAIFGIAKAGAGAMQAH